MGAIEDRLAELGLELPAPPAAPPGVELPFEFVRVHGDLAYVSGHGPLDGDRVLVTGSVGGEVTVEQGYEAARATALSMFASLKAELGELDRVTAWIKLLGFVKCAEGFNATPAGDQRLQRSDPRAVGRRGPPLPLGHRRRRAPVRDAGRGRGRRRDRLTSRCGSGDRSARVTGRADRLPRPPAPGRAGHAGGASTSRPATPSATARPPRSTGSQELGVAEHVYRFTRRAGGLGAPVLARVGARRPRRLLRLRARGDRPAARDRGRLRPRPRGPDREPARGARLGLRGRLGALPARPLARHRGLLDLGHAASRPRRSGGATSRRSPSRRSPGSTTSSPTPTW